MRARFLRVGAPALPPAEETRRAHVYHYKTFTIMVWNYNLLADLGGPPVAIAWRHPLTRRIVCRSGVPAFRTLAE
jgi:hypothetical protein